MLLFYPADSAQPPFHGRSRRLERVRAGAARMGRPTTRRRCRHGGTRHRARRDHRHQGVYFSSGRRAPEYSGVDPWLKKAYLCPSGDKSKQLYREFVRRKCGNVLPWQGDTSRRWQRGITIHTRSTRWYATPVHILVEQCAKSCPEIQRRLPCISSDLQHICV